MTGPFVSFTPGASSTTARYVVPPSSDMKMWRPCAASSVLSRSMPIAQARFESTGEKSTWNTFAERDAMPVARVQFLPPSRETDAPPVTAPTST
jgi:hypothetical protein